MTPTIVPNRWLESIKREYLTSFIKEGGASVKFAVPIDESLRGELEEGLLAEGTSAGYIVAHVASADTRVQMMERVFFRIAEQVPWQELCRNVLFMLAQRNGYTIPQAGTGTVASLLAASNSLDPDLVRMDARRWFTSAVFREPLFARDFRVAMTHLCEAELSGGPDGETTLEVLADWLTGRNTAIPAVTPYSIFTKINRSNARHLLESLLRWIRFAGYAGLLIILDTSRVTIARNPRDGLNYYRKDAMIDSYELLRQFIDGTDRMTACLLVVTPAAEFLDVEPLGRGMGAYDALRLRVFDEVRDGRLVNPMGTLVRLSRDGLPL